MMTPYLAPIPVAPVRSESSPEPGPICVRGWRFRKNILPRSRRAARRERTQVFATERFLCADRGHQRRRILNILAHGLVAGITLGRGAALLPDRIALGARTEFDVVVKGHRPAHVGASGSIISEDRFKRSVSVVMYRKPLVGPALQRLPIDAVLRVGIENPHSNGSCSPVGRGARL